MTKKLLFAMILASTTLRAQQNPVIIELFTSQGCSSCPAADKNLTEILQKAAKEGQPVYGLSFHVDYWNYIGWKDPYSSKAFTEQQRKYSEQLGLSSIYTPQMIVNGTDEFVGANKNASERAITKALNQPSEYQIAIGGRSYANGKLKVNYSIAPNSKIEKGDVINLAIVEKSLENYVPRGENSGRKLHHDNVVKWFSSFPLKEKGELEIAVSHWNEKKYVLVVYIQNSDWTVLGVASIQE
jgi:hypothetical protein